MLQPAARSVSSVLSQQIFQNNIVQHGVCQKALQLSVLILKRFQAVSIRNVHTTVFSFELVERRGTEAMPAAHVSSWHPSFLFFDHPDNLGFGKTTLSHLFAPSKVEQTLH
ncbi:putative IS3-family mobile element-associated protein [Octadecabacter antarcticus 307]|uniref:Putative IS3-family mobile element-associated protein n=1 Tax=Octadecabacter antarcticus 307 TaxID=391626 RepID=M9R8F6_9RHOB|nr:putative IS3-family mobile element-associated protein [Octadecabacter antarcticus 307]